LARTGVEVEELVRWYRPAAHAHVQHFVPGQKLPPVQLQVGARARLVPGQKLPVQLQGLFGNYIIFFINKIKVTILVLLLPVYHHGTIIPTTKLTGARRSQPSNEP
jgi:hypothetical protein